MRTPRLALPVRTALLFLCLGSLFGFGGQANPPSAGEQVVDSSGSAPELSTSVPGDSNLVDACIAGHIVYKVKILNFSGPVPFGEALNNHAQIVGERETPTFGSYQAAIWNGRNATAWQTFARPYSVAWDINDAGTIVGTAVLRNQQRPVIWRAFKLFDLGTIGGSSGEAFAINAKGQVAGYSSTTADQEAHATLWTGGKAIDLGTLSGGTLSIGRGINDRGEVVGYSRTGTGGDAIFATLWKNGKAYNLGLAGGTQSFAEAINNKGEIVGSRDIDSSGDNRHAIIWENGKPRDLLTLGGAYSQAYAINQRGVVVGISQNSRNEFHGTVWYGAHILDINTLLAPGTKGIEVKIAWDINDHGEILVAGNTPSGERYMLLTPVRR